MQSVQTEDSKAIEIIMKSARQTGLDIKGGKVIRASSRFCFGVEHGDYNGTELFGIGTDKFTWIGYKPNGTTQMRLFSANFPSDNVIRFNLDGDIPARKSAEIRETWGRFPLGTEYVRREVIARQLIDEIQLRVYMGKLNQGADVVVYGNIPGGGMSRSASLTNGLWLLRFDMAGISITEHNQKLEIVDLAQAVENEYIGSPCGKLDQTMIMFGQAGMGTRYNPKNRSIEYVKFGGDINSFRLAIMDTGTDRPGLEKSTYALRRRECERLVEILNECPEFVKIIKDKGPITCLADIKDEELYNRIMAEQITGEYLEQVSTDIGIAVPISEKRLKDRLNYIFHAQQRFYQMINHWKAGNIIEVGAIFRKDGIGLRDDYKISGPELETMCDIARGVYGVVGERMLGGGDKGASGALVWSDAVHRLQVAIELGYKASRPQYADKCAFHVCKAVDGIKIFENVLN